MLLKCRNFPNLKVHYFGISVTVLMIMHQIQVAFATNGAILPMAVPMNNVSLMNVAYHQPQSAMTVASLPHQNMDQTIERSNKGLSATGEDADGADYLARNFGVPREYSQKHLDNIREEEGKEYPDSPFVKFADMEMPEKVKENGDEHKDRLMKKHDKHLEDDENAVFHAHNGNGLETIDENSVANASGGHRIEGTTSHEDAPIRILKKDPRLAHSDPPASQGDAARRIRLFKIFKNRASSIIKQKGFHRRRRTFFSIFGGGKKKRGKKSELRRR